jgi:hypothetical protein
MAPLQVIMQYAAVYHLLGPCNGRNRTLCNECKLAAALLQLTSGYTGKLPREEALHTQQHAISVRLRNVFFDKLRTYSGQSNFKKMVKHCRAILR